MVYPIISCPSTGGWCTRHVGVWAAVQCPRKAGLEGGRVRCGGSVRGGVSPKEISITPTPSLGLHPRERFSWKLGEGLALSVVSRQRKCKERGGERRRRRDKFPFRVPSYYQPRALDVFALRTPPFLLTRPHARARADVFVILG